MNTLFWCALAYVLWIPLTLQAAMRKRGSTKKVLIIQTAKLGDMVCTTGMFRALKQSHPDWEIHVLCRPQSAVVLERNPFVDRVITYGSSRSQIILRLRPERYDVAIAALPDTFFSTLGLFLGAPLCIHTFTPKRGVLLWLTRFCNTHTVTYTVPQNTFVHYLRLLEPLDVAPIAHHLDFFPFEDDRKIVRQWMNDHGLTAGSFLCFNISAGNAIKEWPLTYFRDLCNACHRSWKLPIVISTQQADRVVELRTMVESTVKCIDASTLSLSQLALVLEYARAFVAVDTGPLYIAYAMNTRLIAIVGGSHPAQQLPPEGDRVIHVLPPAGTQPWMFVTQSPREAGPEQQKAVTGTTPDCVLTALTLLLSRSTATGTDDHARSLPTERVMI
jgi:ADP-heptose:LPS heptosyltransferase